MTLLLSIALLIAASVASAFAGFCLLGGPDGAILSRDSFLFGVPSLLVAISLTYVSTRLVPVKPYIYAPALTPVVAWLGALAVSQKTGSYLWLLGTPGIFLAALAYWIISRVHTVPEEGAP
jgi:hypothetical protein